MSNVEHVRYIGERIHVLKKDGEENGLFGKVHGNFQDKIGTKAAQDRVRAISNNKQVVYRSVISFKPETLEALGLTDLEKFKSYVKTNIYDIAKNNNIDLKNFEYLAAVHAKTGQPHIHIMFWDKSKKVQHSFVDSEIPSQISESLENDAIEMMKTEQLSSEENAEEIPKGESTSEQDENYIESWEVGDKIRVKLLRKANPDEFKQMFAKKDETEKSLSEAADGLSRTWDKLIGFEHNKIPVEVIEKYAAAFLSLPTKGSLKFAYLSKDAKEKQLELIKTLLEHTPKLRKEYNRYINSRKEIAEVYNSKHTTFGRYKQAEAVGKAIDGANAKISNRLLKIMADGLHDSAFKLSMFGYYHKSILDFDEQDVDKAIFYSLSREYRAIRDNMADPSKLDESIVALKMLSKGGNGAASYLLGKHYENDDFAIAEVYYKTAIIQGNNFAAYRLGTILLDNGQVADGLHLLESVSSQNIYAAVRAGNFRLYNNEHAKALELYEKAEQQVEAKIDALQGKAEDDSESHKSQLQRDKEFLQSVKLQIAICKVKIPKHYDIGIEALIEMAENDVPKACIALWREYCFGDEQYRDFDKGISYLEKAVQLGDEKTVELLEDVRQQKALQHDELVNRLTLGVTRMLNSIMSCFKPNMQNEKQLNAGDLSKAQKTELHRNKQTKEREM